MQDCEHSLQTKHGKYKISFKSKSNIHNEIVHNCIKIYLLSSEFLVLHSCCSLFFGE